MKVERRYHLTFSDFFFIGITVLLGLGAINSQNNLLFVIFGLALGAILASGLISGTMLLGIEIEREISGERSVGHPMHIRYRVRNRARFLPAFCLLIEEWPGSDVVDWKSRVEPPLAFVGHVGAKETVLAETTAWPLRRGTLALDVVEVSSRFPFGLLRKGVRFHMPRDVLVQPRMWPLQRDTVARLASSAELGQLSSREQGRGDEFYSLREYVPGDSMRMVAWRASARSDALLVREYARPATTRFAIIINVSGHEASEDADERAIVLGASLLREGVLRGYEVGVVVPNFGMAHRPVSGARHLSPPLDMLAQIDLSTPDETTELDAVIEGLLHGEMRGRHVTSIVVHADAVDAGVGPRDAIHFSAADLTRYCRVDEALPAEADA